MFNKLTNHYRKNIHQHDRHPEFTNPALNILSIMSVGVSTTLTAYVNGLH